MSKTFETEVAGRTLTIEVGKLAPQTNASVTVQYGDTMVLATAVMGKQPTRMPYFPLLVDYEERLYAAGKIKGSRFIKREGRPTDEAVLSGRLIDRSVRPLFNQALRRDIQVVITILSIDKVNDPDFPALMAASTALAISDIPWEGPIGAVAVAQKEGKWIVNPSMEEKAASELQLFVSGKDLEVIMIEAAGKEVAENAVADGLKMATGEIAKLTDFIRGIQKQIGKPKAANLLNEGLTAEETAALPATKAKAEAFAAKMFAEIMAMPDVVERGSRLKKARDEFAEALRAENAEISEAVLAYAQNEVDEAVGREAHSHVMKHDIRVDGRKTNQVRPLSSEVGLVPRAHGSGLFNRGETQVLSVVTLGGPGDKQTIDDMEGDSEKPYMHHYNFPGFSVGEVKPMRGAGRREIGHGALAEKALVQVLPKDKQVFPYTIRVVSETLSSNSSSSQASICGSSLALMDAGVPIKAPVAGIAMGLMTDPAGKAYKVLTDIQGIEDHAGDMDFKIAGTKTGITAIQLDIKLGGISLDICKDALSGAKTAREQILEVLTTTIAAPRAELSEYAPRIVSIQIDKEKIGEVIGPGGKVINKIIEETGVEIDIEEDGLVMITSTDAEMMKKAKKWVEDIVKDIQIGEVYEGEVVQIVKDRNSGSEIGAIVQLTPGKDGMVHISALSHERVPSVSSVVKVGDVVKVKVVDIDAERGRIGLSMKALTERPMNMPPDDRSDDRGPRRPRGDDRRRGGGFS